jgi:hypothetical protein
MNDRAEIEARLLKAAAALLHAGKKAAAAFEECGFMSVRSFKTKQPRGHKNKAALSTKKPRSAPSFIVRVQQSRSDRTEIKAHLSKAATALLNACNKAWHGSHLCC